MHRRLFLAGAASASLAVGGAQAQIAAINVRAHPFNAVGNGIVDDSSAIQSALEASADSGSGTVYLPKGIYRIDKTIVLPRNAHLVGEGPELSLVYRAADFGDSFVAGSDVESCGGISVENIWFTHSKSYVPGAAVLADRVTSGAWFRLYGAQQPLFRNCYFWRLPHSIAFHGGSVFRVRDCSFVGIWDHQEPKCQEGISYLAFEAHGRHGTPKDLFLAGTSFFGAKSDLRRAIVNQHSVEMVENIGSRFALAIDGLETATIIGNYFQCANESAIAIRPRKGAAASNLRFVGNFFDSSRVQEFEFGAEGAEINANNVIISGNVFNGELNGLHAIVIRKSGDKPSLLNFVIQTNTFNGHVGTPVIIEGGEGGTVASNTISNYNCLNVAHQDPRYTAAIWVTGLAGRISINGNVVGGGPDPYSSLTRADNHCYDGILVDTEAVQNGVRQTGTVDGGVSRLSYVTTPAVPGSGQSIRNLFSETASVNIFGGTVSSIAIGSSLVASGTNQAVTLKSGESIILVYRAAPQWVWHSLL